LGDERIVKPDPTSDALLPRFLRVSFIGLLAAALVLALGIVIRNNVTATSDVAIAVRVTGAALRGLGIGFGLLFLLTAASGSLYAALRKMTRP
jgi:hypothetical protein